MKSSLAAFLPSAVRVTTSALFVVVCCTMLVSRAGASTPPAPLPFSAGNAEWSARSDADGRSDLGPRPKSGPESLNEAERRLAEAARQSVIERRERLALQRTPLVGATWYVTPTGAGSGSGADWANASGNLQVTIDAATMGDRIWVAAGVYKPTNGTDRNVAIVLRDGVSLYGGFAGTEPPSFDLSLRDFVANETIFSGDLLGDDGQQPVAIEASSNTNTADNSLTILDASGVGPGTVIDGITFTAGNANIENPYPSPTARGAGIYVFAGELTVNQCRFSGNAATAIGGGGIYGGASVLTVSNGVFSGNQGQGGAIQHSYAVSSSIAHCEFRDNDGGAAGAVALGKGGGTHYVGDCEFSGNTAFDSAGAAIFSEDVWTTIERSTFTGNVVYGGDVGDGGAIYSVPNDGTPRLLQVSECDFSDNRAVYGGAIMSWSPSIFTNCSFAGNVASKQGGGLMLLERTNTSVSTVTGSTFTGNAAGGVDATWSGGGAIAAFSSVEITGSSFLANDGASVAGATWQTAAGGGAILVEDTLDRWGMATTRTAVTIDLCTFEDNVATNGDGGAILNWGSDQVVVTNSQFLRNTVTYRGGAICNKQNRLNGRVGLVRLSGSTLSENQAEFGGGVFSWVSSMVVDRTDFAANVATAHGGALVVGESTLSFVTNSIFRENVASAGGGGGALLAQGTVLGVVNSTIVGNSAGLGSAVAALLSASNVEIVNTIVHGNTLTGTSPFYLAYETPVVSLAHSLVQDAACPPGVTCGDGVLYGQDPLFAGPSDFRLLAGSPAIDGGDNLLGFGIDPIQVDFEGKARALSAEDPADMGAFEYLHPVSTDYVAAVLASDPVLYWSFEEDGLDPAQDRITQLASNALLPQQGATRELGMLGLGRAASFSGTRDYARTQPRFYSSTLSVVASTVFDHYAIEMWVKLENAGGIQYLLECSDGANHNAPAVVQGFSANGGQPALEYYCPQGRTGEIGPTTLNDNEWHHLVFEADVAADLHTIYVDGQLAIQAPSASPWRLPYLGIGATAYWDGLHGVDGLIDELAFYDLSSGPTTGARIASHYYVMFAATDAPPVASPSARPVLYASIPNPFNPSTTIRFDLPRSGKVELAIYDVAGRRVRTLVQESMGAGSHEVIWRGIDDNGRQVASGVYLYRLRAGSYEETRRMTLLK